MCIHKMQVKRKGDMHVCDGISFSLKKKKEMSFLTAWVTLECVMLSEISRCGQTDATCPHIHGQSRTNKETQGNSEQPQRLRGRRRDDSQTIRVQPGRRNGFSSVELYSATL